MLFTSPVYSQASGSIAGITYLHNRSGTCTQAKRGPTNRSSPRQQVIRTAVASVMPIWGEILTVDQRAAWRLYAANVPWTNKLGQTIFLTGHQHFLRCNVPRIQAGIAIVLDAPIIYDLGTWTPPAFITASDFFNAVVITYEATDHWCSNVGGHMLCWIGLPKNESDVYFKGPWRFAGRLDGAAPPPASPHEFSGGYRVIETLYYFVRLRIIQTDGRMSMPIVLGPKKAIAAKAEPPPGVDAELPPLSETVDPGLLLT